MLNEMFQPLKTKAIRLSSSEQLYKDQLSSITEQLEDNEKKLKELRDLVYVDEQAHIIMKQIIDKLSYEAINKIKSMITFALRTICYDRDYTFEMKVDDKRDTKTIDFFLIEKIGDETVTSNFDAIGGGIQSIVGFVLQVYFILAFNQARIMFCDESFSQLSDLYIPTFMEFMKALSEKKGFIFVLISHDNRFMPYADRFYHVDKGKAFLKGE